MIDIYVIGEPGSGKTVYLSQLLCNIAVSSANAGLTALVRDPDTIRFLHEHAVKQNAVLPSTALDDISLRFDLIKLCTEGVNCKETVVLHRRDLSAVSENPSMLSDADGVIWLLDLTRELDMPFLLAAAKALTAEKHIPIVLCMTKTDLPAIREKFTLDPAHDLVAYQPPAPKKKWYSRKKPALPPMEYRVDADAKALLTKVLEQKTGFAVAEYNVIATKAERIVKNELFAHAKYFQTQQNDVSLCAISSLGCGVTAMDEIGLSYPAGEICPMRITEPLYLLLCKCGYLTPSEEPHRAFFDKE